MLTLFTTTAKDIFKRDLLNVCCYQCGKVVRFGYRAKHVTEDAKWRIKRWLRHFESKKIPTLEDKTLACIIYCEWLGYRDNGPSKFMNNYFSQNPVESLPYRFHPVRLAEVYNVDTAGDAFIIDLKLKGFYNYDGGKEAVEQRRQRFENQFVKGHPYYPLAENPVSPCNKFVRLDHFVSRRGTEEEGKLRRQKYFRSLFNGNWLGLASHVSRLRGLQGATFFKVKSFREERRHAFFLQGHSEKELTTPFTVSGQSRSMRLRRGRKHSVRISIYQPDRQLKAPTLTLKPVVETLGPFEWQGGGRGVYEAFYIFHIEERAETEYSTLRIEVEGNGICSPVVQSPVEVYLGSRVLIFLSLVFGALLIGADQAAYDIILSALGLEGFPSAKVWRQTASFTARVVGAGFFAYGVYMGYRRFQFSS